MKRALPNMLIKYCSDYDITLTLLNYNTILAEYNNTCLYYSFLLLPIDPNVALLKIITDIGSEVLSKQYWYNETNKIIQTIMEENKEIEIYVNNKMNSDYVTFKIDEVEYKILKPKFSVQLVKK